MIRRFTGESSQYKGPNSKGSKLVHRENCAAVIGRPTGNAGTGRVLQEYFTLRAEDLVFIPLT